VSGTLKDKTIKGVWWSFADNISGSGVSFLVGLILARILSPEEYGVMAMIAIFIAISNSIIDSGFSSALIRKIDVKDTDYNTVFYFNIVISICLYILLWICAPAISRFFSESLLIPVIRVLGLVLIINSCSIIQRTVLVRNIDFKTQTKVSLIASLVSGGVGITMALYHCGVWSLVGQQLSRQFFNSVLLWIYGKWRPLWEFSYKSFKDLFGFGSKLLLSGLIDVFYKNVYYIVIGRYYSATQLGQYTRAEQFSTIFSSNLTSVVQRVSYPVLSSIQEEPERLRDAYRKIIKVTMLITFALMFGLAAIAKPLIVILIGEKWLMAVPFLQIICFSEMLYPLHAINLNILQVRGYSGLFLKLEIVKKMVGLAVLAVGIRYNPLVLVALKAAADFLCTFINAWPNKRLLNYSIIEQWKDIIPSVAVSILMAAAVMAAGRYVPGGWLGLGMQILFGAVVYMLASWVLGLEVFRYIRGLAVDRLPGRK